MRRAAQTSRRTPDWRGRPGAPRTWAALCVAALCAAATVGAEGRCDDIVLGEAQKKYETGHFEDLIAGLKPCIAAGFSDRQRVEAYRLLSMTYLALDSTGLATSAAEGLLAASPNFQPSLLDPPRFVRLIERLKTTGKSAEVVTSVSKRAENRRMAPATVMVITEEDIRDRGYIDLEELFSDLPGFDVSRTFALTYSNIYQRGYRSNSTERTLFLVDGVEENDMWSNIAYWSRQYPISNVKRVEILYGPASTMYGANALVGVVNVITKDPEEMAATRPVGLAINGAGGSYRTGYGDGTISLSYKNIALSATVRRLLSDERDLSQYEEWNFDPDDYDKVDYASRLAVKSNAAALFRDSTTRPAALRYYTITRVDTIADGATIRLDTVSASLTAEGAERARQLDKEALNQKVGGGKVGYSNISDQLYVYTKLRISDLLIGFETWRSEQASTNWYPDNRRAGGDNGTKWVPLNTFLYVRYDKDLGDAVSFMNMAQYRVTSLDDETKQVVLSNYYNKGLGPQHLVKDSVPEWTFYKSYQISKQFRNEAKITASLGRHVDLVGGLEGRSSFLHGDYRKAYTDSGYTSEVGVSSSDNIPGGNMFPVLDLGAYLQGTYTPWEVLRITLGGRYDYNQIRETGGYGSQFNPRVALVVTPGRFVFKGIYARAFQNASNWTKFATAKTRLLNNPTLDPEKVNNFEASAGYEITQRSFVDVVYYYSTYEGAVGTKIVEYKGGTTGKNEAIGEVKVQGVQASANVSLANYTFWTNYTFTQPLEAVLDSTGRLTGDYIRIGSIAANHFNFGANARFLQKLNLGLRVNVVGKIPVGKGTNVVDNTAGLREFPAHAILNGTIGGYDLLPGLDVQFICNNIFNKEYFSPGIRSADGSDYAYRSPQRERVIMLRLIYNLK